MSDEADLPDIDILARLEVVDLGLDVGGEVGARRPGEVAGGGPRAPVVAAEDGDPLLGQGVGDDQERPVGEQGLIAVLRTRAGDHDGGGEGACPFGLREGAGERQLGGLVLDVHVLGLVRERRLRRLGPLGLLDLLGPGQGQRHVVAALRPIPGQFRAGVIELAVELAADRLHLERRLPLGERDGVDGDRCRGLIRALHDGRDRPVLGDPDAEHQPQANDGCDLQAPLPDPLDFLRVLGGELRSLREFCRLGPLEDQLHVAAGLGPGAVDGVAGLVRRPLVAAADLLHREGELALLERGGVDLHAERPLVGAVERGRQLALLLLDVDHRLELDLRGDLDVPLPVPRDPRPVGPGDRRDAEQTQQQRPGESSLAHRRIPIGP